MRLHLISFLALLFLAQVTAAPYFAARLSVPGRIQAEDYDRGGPGVGYADSNDGNTGRAYRPAENVDVQPSTDGGFNVGWTFAGEWLKYSITVVTAGTYRFELRVATEAATSPIQISIGAAQVGQVPVPATGAWTTWNTIVLPNIALAAGNTEMLITFTGATGAGGPNLNWIDVLPQAFVAPPPPNRPTTLDPAFFDQPFMSGLTAPTDIAFAPDGRIFIAEKQGTIRVWKSGALLPTPFVDLIAEVQNAGDKGLLSIVLHPFFSTNNWLYMIYAVDPVYGQPDESEFRPVLHRLVRYTANGDVADPASRTIILGKDKADGLVSCASTHTSGKMRFAPDNSLMFSFGDGGHYEIYDFGDDTECVGQGFITPAEDIGAFRAQALTTIHGKVLRIDPDTGLGIASNPWYEATDKVKSRVWAIGMRNPFRWSFKPTTDGSIVLLLADVGLGDYEEMNEVRAGDNLLWPCYEGRLPTPTYYPGKNGNDVCSDVGLLFGNPRWPLLDFSHLDAATSYPVGLFGNAITAATIYQGTSYPVAYRGALFIAEHTRGWIGAFWPDFDKRVLEGRVAFNPNAVSAITIEQSPAVYNLDLFYLNVNAGQVRRIQYGNAPPEANAAVFPTTGTPPLTVQFSSDGTFDSRNRAMTLLWEFGDGASSALPNPEHTYTTAGSFTAKLTVTVVGQSATSTVGVNTMAPMPTVRISAPQPFSTYPPASNVQFAADLTGNSAPVTLSWEMQLVHEAHYHPQTGASTQASPSWLMEGNLPNGERQSYRVIATAKNSQGFYTQDILSVVPAGSPSGAPVASFILSATTGAAPLPITVDSLGSADPDGDMMFFKWNWGDGTLNAEGNIARHIYGYGGTYTITLTAMDNYGLKSTFTRQITVTGATKPPTAAPTASPTAPPTQPPTLPSTTPPVDPTTSGPVTTGSATVSPTTSPSATTKPPTTAPSTTGTATPSPTSSSDDEVFDTLEIKSETSYPANVEIRKALLVTWTLGSDINPMSVGGILTVAPEAHLNVTVNRQGELLVLATASGGVQGDFASASVISPKINDCTMITGAPAGNSERLAIVFQLETFCSSPPVKTSSGSTALQPWTVILTILLACAWWCL